MPPETKTLVENHQCLDLDKTVAITTTQKIIQGKRTRGISFICDQQHSCPIVIASNKNPKIDACQLYSIFKRRGYI